MASPVIRLREGSYHCPLLAAMKFVVSGCGIFEGGGASTIPIGFFCLASDPSCRPAPNVLEKCPVATFTRGLYPSYLRGYGNQTLKKPRGLRGSKLGAANEGRKLSLEEITVVESQLKVEGKL
jgi:hypothetical protein